MLRYGVEQGFSEQVEVEPAPGAAARFVAAGTSGTVSWRKAFMPGLLADESVSLACFFQVLGHTQDPLRAGPWRLRCIGARRRGRGRGAQQPVALGHGFSASAAQFLAWAAPTCSMATTPTACSKRLASPISKSTRCPTATAPSTGWSSPPPRERLKKRAVRFLQQSKLADVKISLHAGNIAVLGRKPLNFM